MRHLLLTCCLLLALGAGPAVAQEPEEPEPIDPEIWMVEEDAGSPREPSSPSGQQPAAQRPPAPSAAPAPGAPPPAATGSGNPSCLPADVTTPALAALRAVVAAGPLLVRRTDVMRTRVAPMCGRGRLTLAIVHRKSGAVVARGSRTIASPGSHVVRLRPTRAARRLAGQGPVVLRLRVRFAPAG